MSRHRRNKHMSPLTTPITVCASHADLNYVVVRKLRYAGDGRVAEIRNVAASDHDAVMVPILTGRPTRTGKTGSAHGPKQLKEGKIAQSILNNPPVTADWGHQIKQAACAIVENRKNYRGYRESLALKQLRRRAMQTTPSAQAREQWKQVWKIRRQEREAWQKGLLEAALAEDWQALRAIKTARRRYQWEEALTTQPDWEETMREHFRSIFAKQAPEQVRAEIAAVWEHLTTLCKTTRWRPFTSEELAKCTIAWAGGKSTGPDGISYEALRVMGMHDRWEPRIREEFNDALYKGRCSHLIKKSATILLPKEAQPTDWGQTRPITLSSSMPKWQAQSILGRVGEPIMSQARYQFARPGRQAAELMRRAIRVSKEWNVPFHILKVDVSKASDTVSQPALSATIRDKLAPQGLAWEARLWVDLVENRELDVYAQGLPRPIQQTNGVRQGSPDSPVIFASVIGDVLNETLTEEQEPNTHAMRKG